MRERGGEGEIGRGRERGGWGEACLVTSCHGLTLAHSLAPFKLGDDSPKLFNECIPGGVHKLLIKQNNLL